MDDYEVEAYNAQASECLPDCPGALDIYIDIALQDGREFSGGVTVAPDPINGGYAPYGDMPDTWVAGTLLNELSGALDADDLRSLLRIVAREACELVRVST